MGKFFRLISLMGSAIADYFKNLKSLRLDGINQYARITTTEGTINYASSTRYIRFFYDSSLPYVNREGVFGYSSGSSNYDRLFLAADGVITYNRRRGNALVEHSQDINPGWNSFVVTEEDGGVGLSLTKLYLNGSLVYESTDDIANNLGWPVSYGIGAVLDNSGSIDRNPWNSNIDSYVLANNVTFTLDEIRELDQLNDYTKHTRWADFNQWYGFEDEDISGTDLKNRVTGLNEAVLYNGATNSKDINYPRTYQLEPNDNTPYAENDTGWALDFDGTNEYVNIPDADELSFGANPFSVSVWLNRDEIRNKFIIEKKNEYDFRGSNATRYFFTCYDTNTSNYIRVTSTATDAPAGEWINVTVTGDGSGLASGLTLYQNGVLISSTNTTVGTYVQMQNTTSDLTLGRTSAAYEGLMDNVCLFEKELTQAEVLQIVNEHQVRNETEFSLVSNLVGYWRGVNSRTGTDGVIDQSGNGNHGTMINMTDSDVVLKSPRPIFNEATKGSTIFNGTNQYIDFGDSDVFSFGDGVNDSPFSVSTSVYLTYSTPNDVLITKGDEWELRFRLGRRVMIRLVDLNNTNQYFLQANNILINQWVHICATYDGRGGNNASDGITLYINSVSVAGGVVTSTYVAMDNQSTPLEIGKRDAVYLDSNVSNTSIIAKELNALEVAELYNDGSPIDMQKVTFASDVVFATKLDASEDLTTSGGVVDYVGGNNGTAFNMVAGNLDEDNYPIN